MKMLSVLKFLTVGMGFILLVGIAILIYNIPDLDKKIKSRLTVDKTVAFDFGEDILTAEGCGDSFCVLTAGHTQGNRLIIINPYRGHVEAVLIFTKGQP